MGSTSKDASAGSGDARCCDWQGCRNRASGRGRNGRENKGGDFVVVAEYLNPSICGHLDAGWCALLITRDDRAAIFTDVPTGLCGMGMERCGARGRMLGDYHKSPVPVTLGSWR